MKLLYIIIGLQNEGISNVIVERLNYLSRNDRFELHLLSEGNNSAEMVNKLDVKVNLHLLDIEDICKNKRMPFVGYFTLKKEITAKYKMYLNIIKPDIITTFNLESHSKEIIASIKTDAVKIIEFHGSLLGAEHSMERKNRKNEISITKKFHPLKFFKIPEKKLHNLNNFATVLTVEDLKDRSYLSIPIFQVYNPIVRNEYISEFAKRDKIIVAVGRLSQDKNFKDLILAISKIKDDLLGWKIHIYGEGPEKKCLEELITELQLNHLVFLKGVSHDIAKVYNNAKILISTSLTEGFGRTIIEALSYKIPVISYNCKCGPKEILTDGINGYLIDFDVTQLADKILKLSNEEKLLQFLSDQSGENIQKFNFENIMKQWVDIYDLVVQSKKRNTLPFG